MGFNGVIHAVKGIFYKGVRREALRLLLLCNKLPCRVPLVLAAAPLGTFSGDLSVILCVPDSLD